MLAQLCIQYPRLEPVLAQVQLSRAELNLALWAMLLQLLLWSNRIFAATAMVEQLCHNLCEVLYVPALCRCCSHATQTHMCSILHGLTLT